MGVGSWFFGQVYSAMSRREPFHENSEVMGFPLGLKKGRLG